MRLRKREKSNGRTSSKSLLFSLSKFSHLLPSQHLQSSPDIAHVSRKLYQHRGGGRDADGEAAALVVAFAHGSVVDLRPGLVPARAVSCGPTAGLSMRETDLARSRKAFVGGGLLYRNRKESASRGGEKGRGEE